MPDRRDRVPAQKPPLRALRLRLRAGLRQRADRFNAGFWQLQWRDGHLYGSRGGPASQTAHGTDLALMARGAGIEESTTIHSLDEFAAAFSRSRTQHGPSLIVCKVEPIYVRGEGPDFNGQENKFRLVRMIEETEGIKILQGAKA